MRYRKDPATQEDLHHHHHHHRGAKNHGITSATIVGHETTTLVHPRDRRKWLRTAESGTFLRIIMTAGLATAGFLVFWLWFGNHLPPQLRPKLVTTTTTTTTTSNRHNTSNTHNTTTASTNPFLLRRPNEEVPSLSPTPRKKMKKKNLGAVLFLAPARFAGSIWGIDRFCMLLRAVRSVNQHLNLNLNNSISNGYNGPYPIYILIARDYETYASEQLEFLQHETLQEGMYSSQDRDLIRRWAPNSTVEFVDIDMYSRDALEPNTTAKQILDWRAGKEGGLAGSSLGYASMCRLWSGRLQHMEFLDDFDYYLRMDDDSLLIGDLSFDPFLAMERRNLTYAYNRVAHDFWGVDRLWNVSRPYLEFDSSSSSGALPLFLDLSDTTGEYEYHGRQPYNNFHVARVSFWRSAKWLQLWDLYNQNHLFYKYRVGDANVHAMALMMMEANAIERWGDLPYAHNSNDYGPTWGTKAWVDECKRAYIDFLDQK
jgi:hypothetical protein